MKDFKTYISSDVRFDDERYWRFARRLNGPLHVERPLSADFWVLVASIACLAVALIVGY